MPTPSFILGGEKGWPVKEGKLLGYAKDENGLYRPIPVNFTRNSKSWVTRNGTLLEKAANVPTIGGTGTGKLVLQPERTQKIPNSEGLANGSGWTRAGGNTVDEGVTFRGFAVTRFNRTSAPWQSAVIVSTTASNTGVAHALRICAKYIDLQYLHFITNGATAGVVVDLQNKTLHSSTPGSNFVISAKVTPVGDGYVEIEILQSAVEGTGRYFYIVPHSLSSGFSTTSATGSVLFAMPQCAEGSYVSEYVPSYGAAVTRLRGEAVLDNIKTFAGTTSTRFAVLLKAEGVGESIGGSNSYARFFKGSSTEQIRVDYTAYNNFRFRDSANDSYDNMGGVISSPTADKKMLFAVDGNIARVFYNGAKIGSDYSGAGWDIDKLIFGTGYTLTLETIEIYKDALTDAAAVDLTA